MFISKGEYMDPQVGQIMTLFVSLVICLTIHEAAHAWVAKLQGDTTAESMGRLTLNPLPHVDPVGTVFFPLLIAMTSGGMFGWAKPVPVDPRYFRSQRWGAFLVSGAGPASNLILGFICILALRAYGLYFYDAIPRGHFFYPLIELIGTMAYINAILAVFNLIPLPPLDGGTVFSALLPRDLGEKYEQFIAPYGMWILLAMMFTGSLGFIHVLSKAYLNIAEKIAAIII